MFSRRLPPPVEARPFRTYLLVAFGAFAVALVGVAGYAQNRRLERTLLGATDRELTLASQGLAQQVDDALVFHTLVLEAFAALIEANATDLNREALEKTLFSHHSRFGELGIFYVANAEDVAVFSDSPAGRGYAIEGTFYGDREYVRAMKAANHTVVGAVQFGRRSGVAAVPLATPLHDTSGALRGFVAETLRLEPFDKILRRGVGQLSEGRAVLVDATGHVVAQAGFDSDGSVFHAPPGGESLQSAFDDSGVEVRVAAHLISRLGWTMYVTQPTAVVKGELAAAGRQTLIGGVVALAIALLAARLLAALLAGPVARLADFARSARAESVGVEFGAPSPWAPAEVQVLHATLVEMVSRMHHHAHDLEAQVVARTRALQQSNHELTASLERQSEIHEQLLQTAKMAAVGQLAAGLAHEINNPLGVIIGFGQALQRRLPESSPLAMPVASILREGQRCRDLVTEMLTFSRKSKPQLELVDVNALVAATNKLFEARAHEQGVALEHTLAPGLPTLRANRTQLQQVMVNLGTNALDAMASGGTLTLATRLLGDGAIGLEVRDTGTGISPEVQAHMFEPFFTTKEIGKGTGLGLSLVYEIVRQHGGNIDVESTPGRGTRVAVSLPAPALL